MNAGSKTPGTGTYNISKGLNTSVGSSFDFHCNSKKARDSGMVNKDRVPGPGSYNVSRTNAVDGAPAYSMGIKT